MNDYEPEFKEGDRIILDKSASVPSGYVNSVFSSDEFDGELAYSITWSNGTVNERLAREMDRQAINTTQSPSDGFDIPPEFEQLAEYMDNMVGLEFKERRRREVMSILERSIQEWEQDD